MIPQDYLVIILIFSAVINACFIGVTFYDRHVERKIQRDLARLRHPVSQDNVTHLDRRIDRDAATGRWESR